MGILTVNTKYRQGGAVQIARLLHNALNNSPGYESLFAYGRVPKSLDSKAVRFALQPELFFHAFLTRTTGLPVILENIDINFERVYCQNGLLYRQGDVNDLERKMEIMLKLSDNERTEMGLRGKEFVSKNFSYDTIASKFEMLYNEVKDNLRSTSKGTL